MNYIDIDGWFDAGFAKLYSYAASYFPTGSTFVELGVYHGKSAGYMVEQLRLAGKANSVDFYAVDQWLKDSEYLKFNINMRDCGYAEAIKPIRCPSTLAALKFANESIDFIMIDADHKYEEVKKDIYAWAPKMKAGSIMSGHDIHLDSVRNAVRDIFGLKNVEIWQRCWIYRSK